VPRGLTIHHHSTKYVPGGIRQIGYQTLRSLSSDTHGSENSIIWYAACKKERRESGGDPSGVKIRPPAPPAWTASNTTTAKPIEESKLLHISPVVFDWLAVQHMHSR